MKKVDSQKIITYVVTFLILTFLMKLTPIYNIFQYFIKLAPPDFQDMLGDLLVTSTAAVIIWLISFLLNLISKIFVRPKISIVFYNEVNGKLRRIKKLELSGVMSTKNGPNFERKNFCIKISFQCSEFGYFLLKLVKLKIYFKLTPPLFGLEDQSGYIASDESIVKLEENGTYSFDVIQNFDQSKLEEFEQLYFVLSSFGSGGGHITIVLNGSNCLFTKFVQHYCRVESYPLELRSNIR